MNVVDRFFKYISFNTQSDESSKTIPSTSTQMDLAFELKKEMEIMGLEEINLDKNAYLMASLPSNIDQLVPVIGFISHLDTSPDTPSNNVKPQIIKNYNGKNIVLNKKKNIVLSTQLFPELLNYVGYDIITTDGTTLLGADDKAGIAEIMEAIQYLVDHPEIKHGKIRIAFTPDEEIGKGFSLFNIQQFNCKWAYTVDGGEIGEFSYETFNSATVEINIKGLHIHPGYAKNKMINANLIAIQFIGMLPPQERPEFTENYEGFSHLIKIHGTVEKATLIYNIRDHDQNKLEKRLKLFKHITNYLNKIYPNGTIKIKIHQQYYNMCEIIKTQNHIIELAKKSMKESNVIPIIRAVRGCTDGSILSFKGLPCPNIFTGGLNFHGRYEYIPIKSMEKAVKVIVKMIINNTNNHINNSDYK
ncbi:MAG: peptidase T [Bacteroidales bacterium OttesenSCG-928-I14]|jgi:tripeptide aminopeptidase|nr:peptidase T [Bacteroidales bacterium OttesenSCG-928-I14]